jgi:xanthine dehydrogenase YagT iron-sulfur-binding subunit
MRAFLRHDAFQCGFCTPGQLVSAVSLLREGRAGSDDEIREFMSGNLCRCGAYPNIVAAIRDVAASRQDGGRQPGRVA